MILRIVWQSALILALGVAGAWATWKWNPDRPELYLVSEDTAGPDEISVIEALALEKKGGVIWLDGSAVPGGMMVRAMLAPMMLRRLA